jgi:N utilization substance protein B
MTRREAREQAFMIIFEWEFHQSEIEDIINNAEMGRELEVDEYARKLSKEIIKHIDLIDGKIDVFSTKWKRKRIAKVSLAILRTALGEMLYVRDVPTSVAINEAVEMSKKYATDADAAYINGVLGGAARALESSQKVEAEG